MKKRLLSILLMCCMVLTLLPTTAFAEESTETPPVCSCETACTAESRNAECPVCGAEGASAENCAKYIKPADDAAVQPEGEVSDPQPKTALTALIGGSETVTEVSTADELTAAIADSNVITVKLTGDISISNSLTVNRIVTLDLNGHVLKYESANKGSVIVVEGSGNLTLTDSNTTAVHKFTPDTNGLWVLDEASGTETVTGGVITGGTGYPFPLSITVNCGGGVYIAPGGQLTMIGGNIIGCSAELGGGVCIYPRQNGEQIQFSMSGGSIAGCVASNSGGGVYASGKFQMSGPAVIRSCTVESTDQLIQGGGVYVDGSFEMSGEAKIEGCQAISTSAYGGGVFVNSSRSFVMSENAKIENCQAISKSSDSSKGGGVFLANNTEFTLSGSAVIQNCTAKNSATPGKAYGGGVSAACVREITLEDNASIAGCIATNGSGLYITGSQLPGYGKLFANGGSVDGDVVLGDTTDTTVGPGTITGTGKTEFNGKVTVTPGSTIGSGTFNGEVINNGTITGGTFNGTVNNNGTINDGTFNGEVTNNGTINDGTFNTPITGSGTESDPYQISTAAQLKRFRDIVNGTGGQTQNAGAHAKLMNDIVLNDGTFDENGTYTPGASGKAAEKWTPIAYSGLFNEHTTLYYTGTFDGQGHTIKGLYVSINNATSIGDAVCLGLFSTAKKAVIRNVTVTGYVFGFAGNLGGIVGYLSDGTIENCANYCTVKSTLADTEGPSYVGGIAGAMDKGSVIRDCYNTGTITVVEYREWNMTGGVVGYSDDSAVSNCYNAGKVAGSWNYNGEIAGGSNAGDENGNPSTVSNCYYLDGTGWNAVGNGKGSITNTESKTAAQFANSTVLALLKAGARTGTDPWADECKYLDTAGKTLPVFNGQGDAHDHQSNDWKSNETEHWQVCTCGAVFNKAEHSGGKATCKAKAKCADCGAEYGDTNPNHHGDKLKHVVAKDATTSEEGNIEYWYCEACEKYFSDADAKNEITQAQTVIPKRHSSGGGSGGSSSYPITVPGKTENGTVTVSPRSAEKGDTVTITVKPDSGYQLDDLAVTDKNGKELKLTDKGNGKYTFTMPSGKAKINATFTKEAEPSPFSDVSTSAYYYEAVKWAQEKGITGGIGNGLFGPNRPCTRAQIVTFLWRAAGSPAPKSMSSFTDVPADAFYAKAVAWAVENGITSGTGEGKFSPNAICTRAQSVTFLYRTSGSPAVSGSAEFSDVSTTAFYADAVAWAAKKGITTGIGGGLFGSDNDCTRSQIVTFLWRCKK
ncbi:S-layer homology domain-containing protein [Hominicoprocola fusiformis]